MKRRTISLLLVITVSSVLWAQKTSLPLSVYSSADTIKPLIFYISGDGGLNKFSMSFMQALNKQGYAVIGLNAKSYFWTRKNPKDAANAIEATINDTNKQWSEKIPSEKKKSIVLMGYSFGADVAPFMFTHFSQSLRGKISHIILLSPSPKTDFEVHVLQMLGFGKNLGESVPAEINKINRRITFIVGDDEKEFPFSELTIKNKQIIKMPGGHHYDGDVDGLYKKIISLMK